MSKGISLLHFWICEQERLTLLSFGRVIFNKEWKKLMTLAFILLTNLALIKKLIHIFEFQSLCISTRPWFTIVWKVIPSVSGWSYFAMTGLGQATSRRDIWMACQALSSGVYKKITKRTLPEQVSKPKGTKLAEARFVGNCFDSGNFNWWFFRVDSKCKLKHIKVKIN